MSRKDYQKIAALLKDVRERSSDRPAPEVLDMVAAGLSAIMQADNPSFSRSRFLAACGVMA